MARYSLSLNFTGVGNPRGVRVEDAVRGWSRQISFMASVGSLLEPGLGQIGSIWCSLRA